MDGESRPFREAGVSDEGTARSAARRLPVAGIVKGPAKRPLTRPHVLRLLKLPAAWRAEPCGATYRPCGDRAGPPLPLRYLRALLLPTDQRRENKQRFPQATVGQ